MSKRYCDVSRQNATESDTSLKVSAILSTFPFIFK